MSETSPGPGWWQASDGKWYPPESGTPPPPPPPPPAAEHQGSPLAAQAHQVGAVQLRRVVGKTRNPWGVWLLSLVTLGIYGLWWYYTVNREVRDYNEAIVVQPGVALIAVLFGYFTLWIATIVSLVRTGGRIAQAQRLAGSRAQCSGVVGLLLALVGFYSVYYQSQLNKVWDQYGNPAEGTPIAR